MSNKSDITNRYINIYNSTIQAIRDNSTSVINASRDDAFECFSKLGVPDISNELYRYTNLASFLDHDYRSYFKPTANDLAQASMFKCDVADLDTHGIILVNGYYPDSEKIKQLPDGIWVGSLNEASKTFPKIVSEHYCKYSKSDTDGLVHLNTALASDGIFIYVPDGVNSQKPIQIVNIVQSEEDTFNQHRNLIVVGKNASMTMIICDHALSPHRFLTNAVTEVAVDKNSRFDIIRVQNEHNNAGKITHTFIHQEADSVTSSHNITLHGGLVRNNTYHLLAGEHAETRSNGLYLTDKFQHVDNYVSVDHFAPNCTSNQLFKGALDDMSTGAFNGRILVHKDAQGTNAYQRNNNILLTNDAHMNTRPHLEIYADDVKCSHGATVGQPDDDAMFYLRSRGIDKHQAQLLLMFGFAHEVIQDVPVAALRERLDNLVMQRLHGELSRCASCMVKCC